MKSRTRKACGEEEKMKMKGDYLERERKKERRLYEINMNDAKQVTKYNCSTGHRSATLHQRQERVDKHRPFFFSEPP